MKDEFDEFVSAADVTPARSPGQAEDPLPPRQPGPPPAPAPDVLEGADREIERVAEALEARGWYHRIDDHGHTVEDHGRVDDLRDYVAQHPGAMISAVAMNQVNFDDAPGVGLMMPFPRLKPKPPPEPPEPEPVKTAAELERERGVEYLRVRGFGHVIDDPELLRALRSIILEGASK